MYRHRYLQLQVQEHSHMGEARYTLLLLPGRTILFVSIELQRELKYIYTCSDYYEVEGL
jgi:hypothetical protein